MQERDLFEQGEQLERLLARWFWRDPAVIAAEARQVANGKEKVSEARLRELQRVCRIPEWALADAPDALVERSESFGSSFFVDYKATTRPRYNEGVNQWKVGQVAAKAWQAYGEWDRRSREAGYAAGVALLVYCPFHPRPLVWEWVSDALLWRGRQPVTGRTDGSGMDFVNLDLSRMRSFSEFALAELGLGTDTTWSLVLEMLREARRVRELQTTHHPRSPYHPRSGKPQAGTAPTGFNWVDRESL